VIDNDERCGIEPRKPCGRGELRVPADQVLVRTRARQAELAQRKRAELEESVPEQG
jgi:hypothetical protein